MGLTGLLTGTTGASGGFIVTPVAIELMNVPTRIATATTTFTVGVTSAAALMVFSLQGRIVAGPASAVILGSLLGARTGAKLQSRLPAVTVRRALSVILVIVSVVLVATT
jgi:uncharacterized membrane protein YfcA